MQKKMRLWYRQSAACLNEAMPIGNGKMAAMVYGGCGIETIQIDDATFWSGKKSESNNRTDTPALMAKLRELLLQDNYEEADRIGHDFVGNKNKYGTHMPFGNLVIRHENLGPAVDVQRELDIYTGISDAMFTSAGVRWRRECFMSQPDNVFALRYSSDKQQAFSCTVEFSGIDNDVHTEGIDEKDLIICGNAYENLHSDGQTGVRAFGRMRILTDGNLLQKSKYAKVKDATWIVLLGATETSMTAEEPDSLCESTLNKAELIGYDALCRKHSADVRALMELMDFSLGEDKNQNIPTDERLAAYSSGTQDSGLDALIFQYGRYLTLASSRENSPLPTHMGGIWNDNIYNNQDSTQDMHIDMNVQMQYWQAYPTALEQCADPLDNWIQQVLVPAGQQSAQQEYNAKGWVAHVTSNPWGYTSLGWAYNWGSFTFGGAWCATLLWDRFEFSQDIAYLEKVWPTLKGCADFMLDYLFLDKKSGLWMTGPSYSPENHFAIDGQQYTLSLSTTCDIILVREILTIILKAAKELGFDDAEFMESVSQRLQNLPPYKTGRHGQLQEWFHDFDEPIPNHRHFSHLIGMYPFSQITPDESPELAKAVRVAMLRRYENFEVTSWGFAMLMSLYARIYDGDAAAAMLHDNIRQLAKPNLTFVMPDYVPMWGGTWELDGNTGITAAMWELVAQSRLAADGESYELRLLPALPKGWPKGEIKGLRLRGGYILDISWENHVLQEAIVYSKTDTPFVVMCKGEKQKINPSQKNSYHFGAALQNKN